MKFSRWPASPSDPPAGLQVNIFRRTRDRDGSTLRHPRLKWTAGIAGWPSKHRMLVDRVFGDDQQVPGGQRVRGDASQLGLADSLCRWGLGCGGVSRPTSRVRGVTRLRSRLDCRAPKRDTFRHTATTTRMGPPPFAHHRELDSRRTAAGSIITSDPGLRTSPEQPAPAGWPRWAPDRHQHLGRSGSVVERRNALLRRDRTTASRKCRDA